VHQERPSAQRADKQGNGAAAPPRVRSRSLPGDQNDLGPLFAHLDAALFAYPVVGPPR
jgi:hypothetical protein